MVKGMGLRGARLSLVMVTGRQKSEASEVKRLKAFWSSGETGQRIRWFSIYCIYCRGWIVGMLWPYGWVCYGMAGKGEDKESQSVEVLQDEQAMTQLTGDS